MGRASIDMPFSVERAHQTQINLSRKIIVEDRLPEKIQFIAGIDVAYTGTLSIGAVAVLDYDSQKLVESRVATCETPFPYTPTLLSFRELRPALLSIKRLHTQPDVFLVDGQGLAHPYRCGFASHLGIVLRKPTIGVAKNKLVGRESNTDGDITFLEDEGETIGAKVAALKGFKPLYVSVGNMVSLKTAIKIVKDCTHTSRIPQPILKAHEIATSEKRKVNNGVSVKKH